MDLEEPIEFRCLKDMTMDEIWYVVLEYMHSTELVQLFDAIKLRGMRVVDKDRPKWDWWNDTWGQVYWYAESRVDEIGFGFHECTADAVVLFRELKKAARLFKLSENLLIHLKILPM